ncbi:glycerophosphodiester phosphodiesterase family protein [Leucobacter sp. M11]|uniref:glycerophosphodiester phosphodiesterase family protein n=1 Tax=Leucobacter sp. M11 TaxID=2993565 RepID=UPI002D8096F9|nr:glycerophosphodiester phosphodiesterase family protein [Leucobacter sp. M11]MEB4614250.1 glycerophosphodiester phosphodiesterase family protein [Leucobacter sp. M11]
MSSAARIPLIIGHRGAPGYRPEHTEASYRLAFELGADAVEPDIVATRDGVLVLRHENEISGTTDVAKRPEFAARKTTKTVDGVTLTGWFTEDFTWAELSTLRARERLAKHRPDSAGFDGRFGILRLTDLLAIIDEESARLGRDLSVVVEIKHADYFDTIGLPLDELLLRDLDRTGWLQRGDRLIVEAFELDVLDRLRASGLDAHLVFLVERTGAPADQVARHGAAATPFEAYLSDAGLDGLRGRVDGISVNKHALFALGKRGHAVGPSDLVTRAHARGLTVFTWTLRPENRFLNPRFQRSAIQKAAWGNWQSEFQLALATGIDGIFVDQPDLGVAARDRFLAERDGTPA